jgi:hypothetical protein
VRACRARLQRYEQVRLRPRAASGLACPGVAYRFLYQSTNAPTDAACISGLEESNAIDNPTKQLGVYRFALICFCARPIQSYWKLKNLSSGLLQTVESMTGCQRSGVEGQFELFVAGVGRAHWILPSSSEKSLQGIKTIPAGPDCRPTGTDSCRRFPEQADNQLRGLHVAIIP